MKTLTENITRELLEAADGPGKIDIILKDYSHSKGPLYNALAQATVSVKETLAAMQKQNREAENKNRELLQKIKETESRLSITSQNLKNSNLEYGSLAKDIDNNKEILKQVNELKRFNFGAVELKQIHNVLTQIATTNGVRSEEIISTYFRELTHYEKIISLELEEQRAKVAADRSRANADRWKAEASAEEARCKARKTSIEFIDKLITVYNIKEQDLPNWTIILQKANISSENLANELKRYTTLEQLINQKQKQNSELRSELDRNDKQLQALKKEQVETHEAIKTVREKAVEEVHLSGKQILTEMEQVNQNIIVNLKEINSKIIEEYGNLREQLGDVRAEASLSRAIDSGDPKLLASITDAVIFLMLKTILNWARIKEFNPELAAPVEILRIDSCISSFSKVNFMDLLKWSMVAIAYEKSNNNLTSTPVIHDMQTQPVHLKPHNETNNSTKKFESVKCIG